MNFAIYAPEDGRIIMTMTCRDPGDAAMQEGDYVECDPETTDVTHYVADKDGQGAAVHAKSKLDTRYEVAGLEITFLDLPEGVTLAVGDASTVTTQGSNSVSFDVSGTYTIELTNHIMYLDEQVEVILG